ncbi:hypothetical protein BH11PLA1_BH11PLA1_24340 [soil metagenome]
MTMPSAQRSNPAARIRSTLSALAARRSIVALILGAGLTCAAAPARAGVPIDPPRGIRILVSDRDNDTIWLLQDLNNNGLIENSEVRVFFSPANAAGTQAPANPTAMDIRRDGLVIIGDQTNRQILRARDHNGDGSADGALESAVLATTTTWNVFGFPTGVGFDAAGSPLIVNAGNAANPNDGIYRLRDLNQDGDAEDTVAGNPEMIPFCNAAPLGPGNTSYSPQEITVIGGVVYMRESATTFQGIWACRDTNGNGNGNANDPGEFTPFLTAGNASAVTLSAGFGITPDPIRPASGNLGPALYMFQTATGGIDQIIRARDTNGDGNANGAGEALLVYSDNDPTLTGIDIVALPDGSLLLLDNGAKKIHRLRDTNGDGIFQVSEKSVFFANSPLVIPDMRKLALLPRHCTADIGDDAGDAPPKWDAANAGVNEGDYNAFFNHFFLSAPANAVCDIADDAGFAPPRTGESNSGVNEGDYNAFFNSFFDGCTY